MGVGSSGWGVHILRIWLMGVAFFGVVSLCCATGAEYGIACSRFGECKKNRQMQLLCFAELLAKYPILCKT